MKKKPFCLLLACLASSIAFSAQKAPFHVLYSDDTTHILSCPSPFKPQRDSFREKYLRAATDEVIRANPDVCMLQPGLAWVPWWKSEVVPISEHAAFLERMGQNISSYERYVLNGGDMIATFLDQCALKGKTAFISIRMNDVHHVWRALINDNIQDRERAMAEFQFFADNPDCRLGEGVPGDPRMRYALDWGNPKVREHKFKIIEEICRNYDIDGLELDFMRHYCLFNPKRTTPKERKEIITNFVRRIRKALDENTPEGKHRWLGVRMPGYIDSFEAGGMDPKALASAGVDIFNLSNYYFTDMQMDVEAIRKQLPQDAAVYVEIHYVNAIGRKNDNGNYDWRRTEPEQMRTIAHMAYARGASGVSFFNFPYYRGNHAGSDKLGAIAGEAAEPPFEVIAQLKAPQELAKQPQYYAVGRTYNTPEHKGRPFTKDINSGETQRIELDMAPPEGGWRNPGKLRIQGRSSLKDCVFSVSCNGRKLRPDEDVSPIFPPKYKVAIGEPDDYKAFAIPEWLLKDGRNVFEITQKSGPASSLFFMDIALP